jgi:multidrug resistance efflux pump
MTPMPSEFMIGEVYLPPLLVAALLGLADGTVAEPLPSVTLLLLPAVGAPGTDGDLHGCNRDLDYSVLNTLTRVLLTTLMVLLAVGAVAWKYWDYLVNPWTRNGQLSANVVLVTPRVSGPIVELPATDNQAVEVGELLFRIDPRTFKEALVKATAEEVRTKTDFERASELVKAGGISKRDHDKAVAAYDVAQAEMETARLDLEFTEMRASVSG